MTYVRAHLAPIAFGVAIALGRRVGNTGSPSGSVPFRGIGLLVLVVGFTFATSQASGLLPGFSPYGGVDPKETLDETQRRSAQGGSRLR